MELKFKQLPTDLGGTAVSGCGTIHITEIRPTLEKLSNDLELPFDFNEFVTGSAGKREYSGDLDVVLDNKWWGHGIPEFRKNLEEVFGKENVARHGNTLHLKYPIVGFDKTQNLRLPRTGFVQVDFNLGDYEWQKFYHYCDATSGYKGGHRNLLISAICSELNVTPGPSEPNDNTLVFESGRPSNIVRWKWGENGLYRVIRRSVKDKHGHWAKKQQDTVIEGPYTNPAVVANILLPNNQSAHVMNSLESIMLAVKENYGLVEQQRVWRRAAENFTNWNLGRNFIYPAEISEYITSNDK